MELFGKKKEKKLLERNEIENKSLKEILADIGLKTLVQGEDYEELTPVT